MGKAQVGIQPLGPESPGVPETLEQMPEVSWPQLGPQSCSAGHALDHWTLHISSPTELVVALRKPKGKRKGGRQSAGSGVGIDAGS